MNLKQSDKLIAIIGVVILVIAGIAIVFYTSTGENPDNINPPSSKMLYQYTWKKTTDSGGMEGFAQKRNAFEDTITVMSSPGTVLTSVDMNVNWKDDRTHGLLTVKGKDTLTAEITRQGGTTETKDSTGSGNMSFSFDIHDIPTADSVEADNMQSAEDQIKNDLFDNENEAIFDIIVTVVTGEKFGIRPLKLLRFWLDKGNDFEIDYTFTYYTVEVHEPENNSDDTTTTGQNQDTESTGAIGEFYRTLGYGRGFI
jgi:hypothetical protein